MARKGLTPEEWTMIHSSLEAVVISQEMERICISRVGPCTPRIFVFKPEEPNRVLRFGSEVERAPWPTPILGDSGLVGLGIKPIDATPGAPAQAWCGLFPLAVHEEPVGVLQVTCDETVESPGIEALWEVCGALSVAVRNAETFEKTRRMTFTDDLTALYNSRFMSLYLDRELKRCRRTRSPLSLLFMDLDGFKQVNDIHGHLAGSRTLVEVGTVLEKTVRDADVLIRYGGDEFVILFPETPLAGGMVIAERIRQVIGATRFLESQNLEARVSASIGIAAYPESAEDVRGLIACADRAMYQAKALGKNRVVASAPAPQTQ